MSNILLWKLKKEEHEHEKGAIATAELSFMSFISLLAGFVIYTICSVVGTSLILSILCSGVAAIATFIGMFALVKGMRDAKADEEGK